MLSLFSLLFLAKVYVRTIFITCTLVLFASGEGILQRHGRGIRRAFTRAKLGNH